MLAGTDDHLTWLSLVILNLESTGLTHLESQIRVFYQTPPFPENNTSTRERLYNTINQFIYVLA